VIPCPVRSQSRGASFPLRVVMKTLNLRDGIVSPVRQTDHQRDALQDIVRRAWKPSNPFKEMAMSRPNTARRMRTLAILGAAFVYAPFALAQSATPSTQQSMETMKKMDANKDGMVSKDEYMKFQEMKFETMDKNKDKMITQEEWLSIQLKSSDGGS
jgi:hypothetical protein